jgi:hypothetical protein
LSSTQRWDVERLGAQLERLVKPVVAPAVRRYP